MARRLDRDLRVMLMAPAAGDDVAVTSHSGNHADPLLRPRLEATFIAPGDP
jgi:hypothetical protein